MQTSDVGMDLTIDLLKNELGLLILPQAKWTEAPRHSHSLANL